MAPVSARGEAFVVAQHKRLTQLAFLLTGEQATAQDLAQETAEAVLRHWPCVARADQPEAYVRRMMLNKFLSQSRGPWRSGEHELLVRDVPDELSPDDLDRVDDWSRLRPALMSLPPRQRAAVVLRHYESRPEGETALLLGCSVGTVKSLTHRALASLRRSLLDDHEEVRRV